MNAKITTTIAKTIRTAHAKGASSAVVAAAVFTKHGVKLDRASVTRWLQRERPQGAAQPPASATADVAGELAAPSDEVAVLERQAVKLRAALSGDDLSPSNRAKLVAELRHVLRQIREAKTEAGGRAGSTVDVSDLRKQIFAAFQPSPGTYDGAPTNAPEPDTGDGLDDDAPNDLESGEPLATAEGQA
jgi:hypothetical protein